LHRAFNITNTTYQLVLVPVWAASLGSGDRVRLALVNGQTGKVAIERPFLDGTARESGDQPTPP
jgi:hypothetical protein